MVVKEINSENDFNNAIKSDKLVVFDFFATWCGPCKLLSPKLDEWATKYSNVDFYKIDIDELNDLSDELGVSSIPALMFYKNGKRVEFLEGSKGIEDKNVVEKLDSLSK